MTHPILSVIIPNYNGAQYLERCINSVKDQEVDGIEIIVIDDGSADNSREILQKYEAVPNIKIILKENGGVSSARNAGIEASAGKYIIFVDGDDMLEQDSLGNMINSVSDDEMLIYCITDYFGSGKIKRHTQAETELSSDEFISNLFFYASRMQLYSPCNKIYSAEIIKNNSLRFIEGVKIGEDYRFNLKYFKYVSRIKFTNKSYYRYYHNETSAIGSYNENMWESQIDVVKDTYALNPQKNAFETEFLVKRIIYVFGYYYEKSNGKTARKATVDFCESIREYIEGSVCGGSAFYKAAMHLARKRHYGMLCTYFKLVEAYIKFKNR